MPPMQKLRDFSPTPYDRKGVGVDEDRNDWLVVMTRNRDSSIASNTNFDTALEQLRAINGGEDAETHGAGHWACGWVECIIVRPGGEAEQAANQIRERLENYPLLDEDATSMREHEAYQQAMESYGAREFAHELGRQFVMSERDRELLIDADKEKLTEFFEQCNECGDIHDDGTPNIRRSVESARKEDVHEFIREIRKEHAKCKSAFESIKADAGVLKSLPEPLARKHADRAMKYADDALTSNDPSRLSVERAVRAFRLSITSRPPAPSEPALAAPACRM